MKSISTGVGLCVLGACVLGAAVVSSPHFMNAASAAGNLGRVAVTPHGATQARISHATHPLHDGARGTHNLESLTASQGDSAFLPRLAPDSACVGEPQLWFDSTPRMLNTCPGANYWLNVSLMHQADVNGDGKVETVIPAYDYLGFVAVLAEGVSLDVGAVAYAIHPGEAGDRPAIATSSVLVGGTRIGEFVNALIDGDSGGGDCPNRYAIISGMMGLMDCDGDGALDLVANLAWETRAHDGTSCRWSTSQIWFRNTGYQSAPPPNPYDLDGDGGVNAGDIGVLLLNFGE